MSDDRENRCEVGRAIRERRRDRRAVAQVSVGAIALCALYFGGTGHAPAEFWDLVKQTPPSGDVIPPPR